MEVALIGASSQSGRLEQALSYLSEYFGTLETLRATILKQITWPLAQLHIGVFLLPLPALVAGGDTAGYIAHCVIILGSLYAAGFLLWIGGVSLSRAARSNAGVDRLLRMIPLIGALRRNMALNRFCATYEMQLQAAINLMDGLRAAADASQSALMRDEVARIIPQVRGGSQVGPLLAGSKVFPNTLQRVFRIGEDTGTLDEDLRKWADYYRKAAVSKMEALGSWLPRIITILILMYLGYSIIMVFKGAFVDPLNALMKD